MGKLIYGVNPSKKITPIMIRDAIGVCFRKAHKEVLDLMDEFTEWKSDEEREKFRNLEIEMLIKNAFKEANVDYNNPTKEELIRVLDNLAKLASAFRKPDIVGKHYHEMKQLLDKVD